MSVTVLDAAAAALEARRGGPAVAVVARIPGEEGGPAARILVREDGTVTGTLGDGELDAAGVALGRAALEHGGARTVTVQAGGREHLLYAEAHLPPEELLIVGAGHIAVPLARLGVMLGYRVTVLDDREEFATPDRFPAEATVRRMDFSDPFRDVPLGRRTHVLLVTRAHKYDYDCLYRLMHADVQPRYIGMIGSRRRVRAAFQALLDAGVARERLASVRAPVGLDIGAETPDEIAVSIAAELIQLRRGDAVHAREDGDAIPAARPLHRVERVLDRLLPQEPRHG